MRKDDSRPLARLSSACIRLSCSRDFSTDCRNRSISFRTRSGRSFRLKDTKRGSKVRTALPTANPTEPTTPWMTRSLVISFLGTATKRHKNHKRASCVFCAFLWPISYPARYSQMLSTACSSSTPLARTPTFEPYPADSNRMLRMLRASASTGFVESPRNRRCWLETSRRVRRV